jgi:Tfp pilus assembly protein PilZ
VNAKKDRRANNRTLYETPVSQENLDSGVFTYCTMYNYSKDGLYFESNTQLNPGEEIFIGIENSPYCPAPDVYECYHAVIRWRKNISDSNYKFGYGVKFFNPDARAATTVQKLVSETGDLQPETVKPGKEQRKHTRYPYNKSINYFTQNQRFEGVVKNICRSGAFIQSGHRFTVGEKLSMVLPFVKKQDGAMVKGEVIWTDKKGFGVKFKKTKNQS